MHILGASGHGKVIVDILKLSKVEISGVWDDNKALVDFCGYPVLGNLASFNTYGADAAIIAIGNNHIRKKVALSLNIKFGVAIHPSSIIDSTVDVSLGSVIMANTAINGDAIIGYHTILNTSCSVDHDCIIGNYVHVSPQVGLAGNVHVGEGTHIGIGAIVIQGIKIGKWATIGAGAVVIRDVPDFAVVVGNPGRILKYNSIQK